jgi:cytidine deaminase
MLAVACIKAPSPYFKLLETAEGRTRAAEIQDNLLKQLSQSSQANFASKATDWLSNQFVVAAIREGSPCGACRQIINDFSGPDTIILIDDMQDGVLFRMSDLLPWGFKFGPKSVLPEEDVVDAKAIEASVESGHITLDDAAKLSAGNSYHFSDKYLKSGTAIECLDGRVYIGSSIMNSCTGLNIKSMRAAISRAIVDGAIERNGPEFIKNMAVSLLQGQKAASPLQGLDIDLIHEFGDKASGQIIILKANERILIPMSIGLNF